MNQDNQEKHQAQHKAEELNEKISAKAETVISKVEQKIKDAGIKLDELKEQMEGISHKVAESTKKKPLIALSIAAAVGVVVGKILF